ncbi:MAG: mitomycin resistance protein [bacterium]|nr:mitomycin resistance protein [bacterium]
MTNQRRLIDLVSVGPATLADLEDLGITEVEHLLDKDAHELWERLQEIKGTRVDPCCEDVFRTAIEQARDPNLPKEKRPWHYWSKERKQRAGE